MLEAGPVVIILKPILVPRGPSLRDHLRSWLRGAQVRLEADPPGLSSPPILITWGAALASSGSGGREGGSSVTSLRKGSIPWGSPCLHILVLRGPPTHSTARSPRSPTDPPTHTHPFTHSLTLCNCSRDCGAFARYVKVARLNCVQPSPCPAELAAAGEVRHSSAPSLDDGLPFHLATLG